MDMRAFCPIVKPLLDNVVSEASRIQNLTEALSSGHHKQARQENHIQPSGSSLYACNGDIHLKKTTSDQQPYSVSLNHATLLSEIESLKRELSDVQQKHQNIVQELNQSIRSAQCGINNSNLILPQKMQLFQLKFLQEQNMEHQESLQKMSESLGASEELWKRVPEMEISLEHYKRQVDILQHALSRAESMHKEEIEQLTSKMEKQAIHQQNLQNEVLDLTKKLLQEQLQTRENLVGSVKYEEHVQNPMQEARQGARTQGDSQCYNMDNLSKRRQNILQHDMHGSRQTPELDMGERPLLLSLNSLLKEFMELRGNINTVLRDHEEKDNQKRWDWMKVQEQSQEWERRAGKLVDSLYYFQNHQMLGNKGGLSDGTDMALHTGKPCIQHSPEVMPHKEDIRHYSWPQNSHRPDLVNNKQCQFHLPNGIRYSDSMLDPTIQKHYKDFQRVGFHGNTQGAQRMP
ncbi:hypothetical protein AALO_G00128450 [Alosa alosa]|uniref:Uncharacterized protein n=1 Tax=Alosa alosa TaxID=278164 RepID=A0AAV6GQE1_9TELE|nr:uncharacterized protein LOC125299995 isoform X1 [Alosa alosa]KAG5276152.1 hypothetical protein AALO_G00128450 [Alosa alosa]